jgi:hypothetical protein
MKDKNGENLKAGDSVRFSDRGGDAEGIVVGANSTGKKLVIVPVVIDPANVTKVK